MSRIAVIGSGISGLAAARYLSRKHEVSVFEKDPRVGGHTHTVTVDSSQGPLAVDTGFIVHNDRTYPGFCALMRELGIETQPSDMSFAVTSRREDFEYSSRGLSGFFAQRRNIARARHFSLLREIMRFNREAPRLLNEPGSEEITLAAYLEAGRFDQRFIERYLYPMASAIWSMPPSDMNHFPALTLIRFFHNHGMLGIHTHPKWKTLRGGSQAYLKPLCAPFAKRLHVNADITAVVRGADGISLQFADRPAAQFDEVVFACHGNQILPLLAQPTETERETLQHFRTSRNEVCLHTDSRLLPRRPAARASWNYLLEAGGGVTMTYHMNRLQALRVKEDYCVSLNSNGSVAPEKVLGRMVYCHPIFDRQAIAAQRRWSEISGHNRTHYCGAWWFYGFHEDGVKSAQRVAQSLGIEMGATP